MRLTPYILCFSLFAGPAFAQSPWSFGGSVGYDVPVGGETHGAGVSNALNLNALNSNLTGTGILNIRGRDWKDTHEGGIRATVEIRYASSQTSELFGALSYLKANGKSGVDIGCVDITTTAGTCEATVTGGFDDLEQIGLEVGYRQWLGAAMLGGALKPYFAVRGGVVRTDALSVNTATGANGLANVRLYDETYSYMIGGDLGATYAISPNAEIGGEVGLRYVGKLKDVTLDTGPLGLSSINSDQNGRLSVPVSVRLNATF
jgi:hypothetical protein